MPPKDEPVKDDAYAQALLRQVNAEFAAKQAQKPPVKHFVSKKTLIYLAASILLTIAASVIVSLVSKR
jgi:hypothetical protein